MLVCEDKVVQIISRQMASNHSLLALLLLLLLLLLLIHETMMKSLVNAPQLVGSLTT